jgi:hypothetical protein
MALQPWLAFALQSRSPIKEKTMFYWVKVYGLIAAVVFAPAGMIILSLFVWYQAKAYGSARQRIYKRLSSLVTHHRFFATPLAISRSVSRSDGPIQSH